MDTRDKDQIHKHNKKKRLDLTDLSHTEQQIQKKIKENINPFTNKKYSNNFYKLLDQR